MDANHKFSKAMCVVYAGLLVVLLSFGIHWAASLREWVCVGLASIGTAGMFWRSLGNGFIVSGVSKPSPSNFRVSNGERSASSEDHRLQHVPVALWANRSGEINPLNTAARRLLAPGRVVNSQQFLDSLSKAITGKRTMITFESENGLERALVAVSSVIAAGMEDRLIALMPIESELEAETLNAWRQLVQVLAHEMMNSLTPIGSLSRTALDVLSDRGAENSQTSGLRGQSSTEELQTALEAISRRADQLSIFVDSFRRVSEFPSPSMKPMQISELFKRLETLISGEWDARGGKAAFSVEPPSLELVCDEGHMEQILLNLIKNAGDATLGQSSPSVSVSARIVRGGRLAIEVVDNGPGIISDVEARIFTPFFSTRTTGHGIGLAVVRNLMHGMGGAVRFARRPQGGACFILTF